MVERARAAAFHLLEVALRLHIAQEEEALERFDVRAGGDHVHRDGDARMVFVAELGEDRFRVLLVLVGDLFAERVALAEFLADDLDDVVGVRIGLGEDERLGHFVGAVGGGAFGENGRQLVAEGADDGADLRGVDDVAVEFLRGVDGVLVLLLPAFGAGELFAFFHEPLEDFAAAGADFGFDDVNFALHIDAIGHGVFVGVFRDDILPEERVSAGLGCGGEADVEDVEVFHDLPPEVVDRLVAFIDDHEIEELGRDFSAVNDRKRLAAALGALGGIFIFGRLIEIAALENGIHALDGAYADLSILGHMARGETGDGVKLGELAVVVRWRVSKKFLLGLLGQVAGVDEKEHAFGTGVFEEAVDRADRGEGFARAGGHLHEGTRFGSAKRRLQLRDGIDLALAESGRIKRRQISQTVPQGTARGEPFTQRLRTMKRKDLARAGLGVALVGEAGEHAGGFVKKRERRAVGLHPLQLGGGVFGGLVFDAGDGVAERFLLRFDHADRLGIDKEHVVGRTGVGEVFADGLACAFAKVDGVLVLHGPSRSAQLRVNRIAGDLFGGLVGHDSARM